MRKIKVTLELTLELPDSAEVMDFTDEEGITERHIAFKGRVFRPNLGWMEFMSEKDNLKKYPTCDWGGQGWESMNEELLNEHFLGVSENWKLQEES